MSVMPRFSVAIATYNGARYLPEMLDSILAQTVLPAEIVCSDDASTDETVAIVRSYAEKSAVPIKLVTHAENVGIISNFLDAFRATTCPYVAYCDQDDFWLPTKLEKCAESLTNNVSMVCHPSIVTDAELNPTGVVYYDISQKIHARYPSVSNMIMPWGHQLVVRRDVIDALLQLHQSGDFRDSQIGCNFDVTLPFVASLLGDAVYSNEPQVLFRRHEDATSPAGNELVQSHTTLASRVARRNAALRDDVVLLRDMVALVREASFVGAAEKARCLQAYRDKLHLLERRLDLSEASSMLMRLLRLPSILYGQSRVGFNTGRVLKDLAADLLAIVYGSQRMSVVGGNGRTQSD